MKRQVEEFIKEVENKKVTKEDMLNHISFYQHERLVHLIVTVFVGIIAVLFFLAALLLEEISLLIVFAILLLLFIPYIIHYYFLENNIQRLYILYKETKDKE